MKLFFLQHFFYNSTSIKKSTKMLFVSKNFRTLLNKKRHCKHERFEIFEYNCLIKSSKSDQLFLKTPKVWKNNSCKFSFLIFASLINRIELFIYIYTVCLLLKTGLWFHQINHRINNKCIQNIWKILSNRLHNGTVSIFLNPWKYECSMACDGINKFQTLQVHL